MKMERRILLPISYPPFPMDLKNDVAAELEKTFAQIGGMAGLQDLLTKATDNTSGFSTRQSLRDEVEDFTRRTTPLFDMLPRESVVNPVHQWDAITAIATAASFAGAIDSTGNDADPSITRFSESVRYYRAKTSVGQFTDAMSRPQLKAQKTVDEKALASIKYDIEKDIIGGATGGNNIRGIDDIVQTYAPAAQNIANGAALTSTAKFDEAQRRIVEHGGQATHFLFNAPDRISFKNLFVNQVRYNDPQMTNTFGYTVQKYLSSFGEVDVMYDQFIADKTGSPAASTAYVLDIRSWALGEPTVNGASGIALQDLARLGPVNTKLINYYGLLVYPAPVFNARVYDIR